MAFSFCIERKISAQKQMGVVYSFVYPRGIITQKMLKMTTSTSVLGCAAPKRWSKYTTHDHAACVSLIRPILED